MARQLKTSVLNTVEELIGWCKCGILFLELCQSHSNPNEEYESTIAAIVFTTLGSAYQLGLRKSAPSSLPSSLYEAECILKHLLFDCLHPDEYDESADGTLTAAQAATVINVTVQKIYRMVHNDELPHIRIKKSRGRDEFRFRPGDLKEYKLQRKEPSRSQKSR